MNSTAIFRRHVTNLGFSLLKIAGLGAPPNLGKPVPDISVLPPLGVAKYQSVNLADFGALLGERWVKITLFKDLAKYHHKFFLCLLFTNEFAYRVPLTVSPLNSFPLQ